MAIDLNDVRSRPEGYVHLDALKEAVEGRETEVLDQRAEPVSAQPVTASRLAPG